MDFYDLHVCGIAAKVDVTSAVTKDEKVEENEDADFWEPSWTSADLRRFVEVICQKTARVARTIAMRSFMRFM